MVWLRMNINRLIKMHRAKLGYTQQDLAMLFGVTKAMISLYESGSRNWSMAYIKRLVKLLDIPKADMVKAIKADHIYKSGLELEKMISDFKEDLV